MDWFAVRHVIEDDGAFEERITLWRADSEDEAMERAEAEAASYTGDVGGKPLGLFQSYRLADEPGDAAEVFSLIRLSGLNGDRYLDRFFDSGDELQRTDQAE